MEKSEKPNHLTRTCASCGLPKPLSAFLHLSGSHGTMYGTICSDCRNKDAKSVRAPAKEADEWSSSSSGFRIGAKEKAFLDQKKWEQITAKQEQQKKETKKNELIKSEKNLIEESKQKPDKDYRKFFLETKKTAPIEKSGQTISPNTHPELVAQLEEIQKLFQQEQKHKTGETGNAPIHFNLERFKSQAFLTFLDNFLSDAAPIKQFLRRHSQKPSAFIQNLSAKPAAETPNHQHSEIIREELNTAWKLSK